jgi:hypothetical protein
VSGDDDPAKVMARIRFHLVATLELLASAEEQREYQSRAPVNVSNELFEQWIDFSGDRADELGPPFTASEREAIRAFNAVHESVCARTPQSMPQLDVFQTWPEWDELAAAARVALRAFPKRDDSWLPPEDLRR